MALGTLGLVTVAAAGTPVQCSSTHLGAQTIQVTIRPANTGVIYIGMANMVKATGVGVIAVLAAPTSATTGPFASITFQGWAPAGLDLQNLYLDAGSSGDGAYVSYIVQ